MKRIIILLSFILSITACNQPKLEPGTQYTFNLDSLVKHNPNNVHWKTGVGFNQKVIEVSALKNTNSITITSENDSLPWKKSKYLVCEIWHNNPYSAVVYVDFYKKKRKSSCRFHYPAGRHRNRRKS